MQTQAVYEQRLCAFVDILGFRDLVERSIERPDLPGNIRQLLREVKESRPVWERDPPVELIEARLISQGESDPKEKADLLVKEYAAAERGLSFSDSLVLSATLNERAITGLVTSLLALAQRLAALGGYARGGVCLGLLCHEQDMCFGPAFIDAYDIEQHIAIYPRIVFSPEARETVAKFQSPGIGPLVTFLREDFDGCQFLDFLNPAAFDLFGGFRHGEMEDIRRELNLQLSRLQTRHPLFQTPQRVRPKLLWVARYFNDILKNAPIEGVTSFSFGK